MSLNILFIKPPSDSFTFIKCKCWWDATSTICSIVTNRYTFNRIMVCLQTEYFISMSLAWLTFVEKRMTKEKFHYMFWTIKLIYGHISTIILECYHKTKLALWKNATSRGVQYISKNMERNKKSVYRIYSTFNHSAGARLVMTFV